MQFLKIDIETFSEADLPKTGVYRYAEDPSFEVLLFGVSVDDGPVRVYDLKQGDELPPEIIDALLDISVTKWAFNAQFERVCLSRYLWDLGRVKRGIYLDPHGWRCDMVWAGYMGFPMNLKGAGAALQLDEQKMEEGKSLITYFCKPYRPTSKNGYTNRNLPEHDPEKWELFKAYNARDVEVEMAIADKLSAHPVPEFVWSEYWMDQTINDRGILVDIPMVESAIALDQQSKQHLKEEMQSITKLANPQSLLQMQRWLRENGVELDSLGKKEIANGKPLSRSTILYILNNETYKGDKLLQKQPPKNFITKKPDPDAKYESNYLENDHEAIVERDVWDAAAAKLKKNKELTEVVGHRGGQPHFLYGKVFCGECGAPMTRRTVNGPGGGKIKIWVCREKRKGSGCGCRNVKEEELLKYEKAARIVIKLDGVDAE